LVIAHNKMALAYIDMRESRTAMQLLEMCLPSTISSKFEFNFLRVITLNNLACSCRRLGIAGALASGDPEDGLDDQAYSFIDEAFMRLGEAVKLSSSEGVHPLLAALTALNFSSVCCDLKRYELGRKYGLIALKRFYDTLPEIDIPDTAKAYYVAMSCHNCALLSVNLGEMADAVELVENGIQTIVNNLQGDQGDDGLRQKLIIIGARAKRVPELFWQEAVACIHGGSEEASVWNLAFWDFGKWETMEVTSVLERTAHLRHLLVDEPYNKVDTVDHLTLLRMMRAVCLSELKVFTVGHLDFDPAKVWKVIRKRSFLETSWYATTTNYSLVDSDAAVPEIVQHAGRFKDMDFFAKILIMYLSILGNASFELDFSKNGLDVRCIRAIVSALRWANPPAHGNPVMCLSLRENDIDSDGARELAKAWDGSDHGVPFIGDVVPDEAKEVSAQSVSGGSAGDDGPEWNPSSTVHSLDIANNPAIGDAGFCALCEGLQHVEFTALRAENVGLGLEGAAATKRLGATGLQRLHLSRNSLEDAGVKALCMGIVAEETNVPDAYQLPEVPMSIYTMAKAKKSVPPNATDTAAASEALKEEVGLPEAEADSKKIRTDSGFEDDGDASSSHNINASGSKGDDAWDLRVPRVQVDPDKFDYLDPSIFHSLHALPEVSWRTPLSGIPPQVEQVSFQALSTLLVASCGITWRGAAHLSWMLSKTPSLTELDISNNDLGDRGMVILGGGMAVSNLGILDMKCVGMTLETSTIVLAQTIMDCQTLHYLDLSENDFVREALEHIGKAVSESFIDTLTLKNMGCTDEHIDWFLDGGAADSQRLQCLTLDGNPIGDKGIRYISECMTIGLVELSLENCGITEDSAQTFVNLLSLSPNLKLLNLAKNRLEGTTLQEMVDWMEANEDQHSLRELNLNETNLGDDGLHMLVPILKSILFLKCCRNNITSEGVIAVANAQMLIQLRLLDLEGNKIDDDGIQALTVRFQQELKRSLWNPKQLTSNIEKLILRDNGLPEAVKKSTDAFLKIHLPNFMVEW
jgi:Ran GTPase-activating protein (RanGAP) involved in mRNA processing and transport